MAFDFIAPAVRALRSAALFATACIVWTVSVVLALLLARAAATAAIVAAGGAIAIAAIPAWRRRWPWLVLTSGALMAFLVMGEVVIRLSYFGLDAVTHPGRFQPIGAMDDPSYLAPATEPGVVYTLRAGFGGWVKGVWVSANRYGLRDRAWLIDRASPEVVRIMNLGTSIAMGEGVREDRTYTSVLGQHLRDAGLPVETLNFGVGGYTLGAAQALLRARGLAFAPDVVVQELSAATINETAVTNADLQSGFDETMRTPPAASFFEANSFVVFGIYPPRSLRARLASLTSPARRPSPGPDGFVERQLEQFGQLASARQFTGVVFVPHPINGFGDPQLNARERAWIRGVANRVGLQYVDSYDQFTAADTVEALSIFPAELHPNAEANQRHARALIEALTPVTRKLAAARAR